MQFLFSIGLSLLIFVIFCGTVVPSFFSTAHFITTVYKDITARNYTFFPVTLYWCMLCIIGAKLRDYHLTRLASNSIILFITAMSFIIRLYYVTSFDQEYYSDFRTYWDMASSMVDNGIQPVTNIYIQRALAYNYVIIYLFGNADIVFKISNVILITLTSLLSSYIAYLWISPLAGIFVSLLLITFPETYYASLVPSHDITGTFFLIVSLFIAYLTYYKVVHLQYKFAIVLTCCLSVCLILLEMQRGLSLLFLLCCGISLVLYYMFNNGGNKQFIIKPLIVSLLILAFIPFLFYKSANMILNGKVFIDKTNLELQNVRQLIRYNTFNDGSYSSQIGHLERQYLNNMPKDIQLKRSFMTSLYLSDLYYDPFERPANYILRSLRLYSLSSQMGFYIGKLTGMTKDQIRQQLSIATAINSSYYSLFLIMLICSSVYFLFFRVRYRFVALNSVVFMSTLSICLATIGENQPRYMFVGYYVWPLFIGSVFSDGFRWNTQPCNKPIVIYRKACWHTYISIFVMVVFVIIAYIGFRCIYSYNPNKLIDMSSYVSVQCDETINTNTCGQGLIPFQRTLTDRQFSLLRMWVPTWPVSGQFIKTEYSFHVRDTSKYNFSVFVENPYVREDGRTGFFDIVVQANDHKQVLI